MTGVDTNLLVRLLAADDPAQTRRAKHLFAQSEVLIAKTVLLETEWVLRSAYGISPEKIAFAFRTLGQTAGVHLEDLRGVEKALGLYEAGFDFADAMHLTSCRDTAESFATFDKRLQKQALSLKPAGLPEVVTP